MFVFLTQQLAQVDNFQIMSFNKMLQLLCASRCFPHPKGGRGAISPQQELLCVIYGCCTSANRGPGLFAVPEFVVQKRENARKGMKTQGKKIIFFILLFMVHTDGVGGDRVIKDNFLLWLF